MAPGTFYYRGKNDQSGLLGSTISWFQDQYRILEKKINQIIDEITAEDVKFNNEEEGGAAANSYD